MGSDKGQDATAPPPTSRNVAERAGVSQATVSLVLRDQWRGRVSAKRADAVRTAARELGYRPNLAARNLRMGQARTTLLIVPAPADGFFAHVHAGAAQAAAEHGVGVALCPLPIDNGPANPFTSAGTMLDGVIASSMAADTLTGLQVGSELPLVMLDSEPGSSPAAATVNPDIVDGIRQVARHLLNLGHRRVGHIAAAVPTWTFQVRATGLRHAFSESSSVALTVTEQAPVTIAGGTAAAQRALAADPRLTALVCDDDVLAAGACKAARRLGLRVPEDVSVTGFDDGLLATAVEPELTTVRLPARELGAAGLEAVLAARTGRPAESTVLPATLVVRGSTAVPPDRATIEPRTTRR